MVTRARAFFVVTPGRGEIRGVDLPPPGHDDVLVRTLHTGVSRGTESLIFAGRVPAAERAQMRAPFQDGELPGPVKYGYLNVGVIEEGPARLVGRTVFSLYPHQTAFVVPASAVTPVPEGVPARRAVLAGTVETALNGLWDAAPLIGDRVTVIGAGMVGCCVARLLAGIPGVEATLVDVLPERAATAAALGVEFATPEQAARERDVVLHASASETGLQLALDLLGAEGTVVELSWYGTRPVTLHLGGAFHSRRLRLVASQVGAVAAPRRARRTAADRLRLALELLRDPAYDALLTGSSPFCELPSVMPALADGTLPALCHTVEYGEEA